MLRLPLRSPIAQKSAFAEKVLRRLNPPTSTNPENLKLKKTRVLGCVPTSPSREIEPKAQTGTLALCTRFFVACGQEKEKISRFKALKPSAFF